MRQKLISKKAGSEASAKSGKNSLRTTSVEKSLSLAELLFNEQLSEEEWKDGLKKHSHELTNLLLNKDHRALKGYLEDAFGALSTQEGSSLFDQSAISQLNEKTFLRELLQLAILIEHSTIPPYLTALYSIKDGTNALASQVIRSIAVEEMLHMIMVCNVMNAVDLQPSVNAPQNYPVYPTKLPLNVDFYVGLEKFSPNCISTFIAIESPTAPMVKAPVYKDALKKLSLFKTAEVADVKGHWTIAYLEKFITEHISTIGEYYDLVFFFIVVFQAIEYYRSTGKWPTSFEELNTGGIFKGDPQKQIRPDHYYGSGGKLHVVENLEGVVDVFEEIKGQGEGTDGTIFSTDPSQFEEGFEPAHYFRFKEIFHGRVYADGKYTPFMDEEGMMPVITPPMGKELPVDWTAVYPIRPNLKMEDMVAHPALYAQAKAFNRTYKQLLDAIQAAVEGKHEELANSVLIMYALKEQAVGLMKQPLTGQENAAPTFEYPVN